MDRKPASNTHRAKTCADSLSRKKNFIIVPSNRDREHTLERRGCSGKICLLRRRRRLSTHIEVLRKTHLTFFVSKEIIQLVMQHWDRKSQNNGKSFSPQRHPWLSNGSLRDVTFLMNSEARVLISESFVGNNKKISYNNHALFFIIY